MAHIIIQKLYFTIFKVLRPQGSHGHGKSWKTMENEKIKSRPGKVMENENLAKSHGKEFSQISRIFLRKIC